MRYIIVAYDRNHLIGANNDLLWQNDMNADITRFRELTTGNVVIMGRKTYESIGRPLPNRQNIVITRQPLKIPGVEVVNSLDRAFKASEATKDIYVIGGGKIYNQTLQMVDRIVVTEIDSSFAGDTYFPAIGNDWQEIAREDYEPDDKNKYSYSFVTYAKRQ